MTIIAVFAVRPLIGDTGAGSALFGVALVLLLLVALYDINVDELVGEGAAWWVKEPPAGQK